MTYSGSATASSNDSGCHQQLTAIDLRASEREAGHDVAGELQDDSSNGEDRGGS
jgi:hypothetical protein